MKNVLVVDDSPTMRRMVIASLRELQNVSFDQAASGLEAIEQLALAPVHLMILDLNIPDIHGLEVLEFVRRHPTIKPSVDRISANVQMFGNRVEGHPGLILHQ